VSVIFYMLYMQHYYKFRLEGCGNCTNIHTSQTRCIYRIYGSAVNSTCYSPITLFS